MKIPKISDNDRRAVWWYNNGSIHDIKKCPMATKKECEEFIVMAGMGELESISYQYDSACEDHLD